MACPASKKLILDSPRAVRMAFRVPYSPLNIHFHMKVTATAEQMVGMKKTIL